MSVRTAAVAGQFYPADAAELSGLLDTLLSAAAARTTPASASEVDPPRAYVVPHAGLVFSGPIAATAYQHLRQSGQRPARILLIGPSHRVPLRGLAVTGASAFATPLGSILIAASLRDELVSEGLCQIDDEPHAKEHSLEVQLPFLRHLLPAAELLPIVGGDASPESVAALFAAVWDDKETLILISSDLSHFLPYEEAVSTDTETATFLESLDPRALEPGRACGRVGLGGLIALAKERPLSIERLDLRNSGDTFGSRGGKGRNEVVGYGAWAVRDR